MELTWTPPNLVLYAVPFFLIFLTLEIVVAYSEHRDWFKTIDTAASLSMGIGNLIIGLIFNKIIVFGAYLFMYALHLRFIAPYFSMPTSGAAMWIALFFADDLSYYVFHRTSHSVRWFWASHVIHHSSEKYNLGTALRQTWTGNLAGGFVFWLWLPLVGFHPLLVVMMQQISLLYQFWIHTEGVDRLPRPIEFIFNTPSHHRVHHGSDLKYLDKNHAGILIIWDRMFGTFQVEEEHPQYGLVTNLETFNPVKIALHEWFSIAKDVVKHPRFARQYIFGKPGWSHDGSRLTTEQLRAQATQQDSTI